MSINEICLSNAAFERVGDWQPLGLQGIPIAANGDTFCNTTGSNENFTIFNSFTKIEINSFNSINNNMASIVNLATNSWETDFVCCVHPSTVIDDLNVPISELESHLDPAFKKVLKLGNTKKFIRIKQNALGDNIQNKDILMTGQHPILHDGKEVQAQKLVNGNTIIEECELTPVYALMFDDKRTVKMQGVDVWQWSEKGFNEFLEKRDLEYTGDGFRPKNIGTE